MSGRVLGTSLKVKHPHIKQSFPSLTYPKFTGSRAFWSTITVIIAEEVQLTREVTHLGLARSACLRKNFRRMHAVQVLHRMCVKHIFSAGRHRARRGGGGLRLRGG